MGLQISTTIILIVSLSILYEFFSAFREATTARETLARGVYGV